jgi:hypothetical protein
MRKAYALPVPYNVLIQELVAVPPTELTGRSPEQVSCRARVVHVDRPETIDGLTGVGAAIERFERIARSRTWDN